MQHIKGCGVDEWGVGGAEGLTWQPYLICITVDASDATREGGGR